MFERLMRIVDWTAIPLGCITMICAFSNLGGAWLDVLISVTGVLGALYALYAIYMFVFQRVRFDWHLINGNFLRKVVSLTLLMPFTLTMLSMLIISSPKELSYQSELYSDGDRAVPVEVIERQESPNIFWTTYFHFIDPGNQHMTTSKEGRVWAACVAIMGVFLLNGLLVSSIIGWVDSRKERWLKGDIHYRGFFRRTPHYVIIGGNDMVSGIVEQIFKQFRVEECNSRVELPYILIQTSRDVESFRQGLFTSLSDSEQRHVVVMYGHANSRPDIAELCLATATEVYILGEECRTDDVESYHDTMNMACLQHISREIKDVEHFKLVKDESGRRVADNRLVCRVMFEYQTTFSVFQFSELSNDISQRIRFCPFNYYEMWAQRVLVCDSVTPEALGGERYLPLEGEGIDYMSDRFVHLFIVGMSRMGVALAIEAAHLAHYPNYHSRGIRTRITFIDSDAEQESCFFVGRFKELFRLSHWRTAVVEGDSLAWGAWSTPTGTEHLGGDFMDVEWEFISGGMDSAAVQGYIGSVAQRNDSIVTIASCLSDPSRALASALYIDRDIYDNLHQVLVYNRYGDSLISEMTHRTDKQVNPYHNKLRAFGMASECYDAHLVDMAERVAERINAEYERLYVYADEGVSLGKSVMAKWWSNIYAANSMWTKLRSAAWRSGEPMSWRETYHIAVAEHNRWNMEQLLMGYRPLREEEQVRVVADIREKNPLKSRMAHYDICSFERLKRIDRASIRYDWGLSQAIREIYRDIAAREK